MGRIGPLELGLIMAVALLLFGAGRVAEIGKGLGESIRNFKKGLRDDGPPELTAGDEAATPAAGDSPPAAGS